MISIEDAKNVQFKNSVKGYKKEEVDQFIDDVVATLEQNKKEKIELVKKLDILAKRIEQYRKDEADVRGALINAEKVKVSAVKQAEEKVAELLNEAKAEAKRIIHDANMSVESQKNSYLKLQADTAVLKEQILATYNNHIKLIEELPSTADIGQTKIELDKKYPLDAVSASTAVKTDDNSQVVNNATPAEDVQVQQENSEEMTDISNE